jgi:hypothetical protein
MSVCLQKFRTRNQVLRGEGAYIEFATPLHAALQVNLRPSYYMPIIRSNWRYKANGNSRLEGIETPALILLAVGLLLSECGSPE